MAERFEKMDAVAKLLSSLEHYHSMRMSDEAMGDYGATFGQYDLEILSAAIEEWKYKNAPTARFPSMADLVGFYVEVQNRLWQKQKEGSPTTAEAGDRATRAHGQLARHTFDLIMKLQRSEISMDRYIIGLREMDRDFPGLVFNESVKALMLSSACSVREHERCGWSEGEKCTCSCHRNARKEVRPDGN